jgi:hypothetical protein
MGNTSMILSIPLSQYNKQYVIFMPPVKNNMMDGGLFIRILYSPINVVLNGLFIYIRSESFEDICVMERDVLKSYETSKRPIYSVERNINKYLNKKILKISGIWENDTTYGLAYKLIE